MAPPRKCPKQRILERTDKSTGCWVWLGPADKDGYGQIGIGRRAFRANRVAYEQFIGPIPDGMWVLHECDNPSCVNPEHLFLGSPRDNVLDMHRKGRAGTRRGEAHPNAKVSAKQVDVMRRLYRLGGKPAWFAEWFRISQQHAWAICAGKTWRNA